VLLGFAWTSIIDYANMPESLTKLNKEIVACRLCPRLVEYREKVAREKRAAYADFDYWGKPVPGFGDPKAELLIVGLAPGAHGANRTGRVFTGDSSGTFLFRGLHKFGFASKADSVSRDDGLVMNNAYVVATLKCVPPGNKPLTEEILKCRPFLLREMELLTNLRAVLVLGRIGMEGYLDVLRDEGHKIGKLAFEHGAEYQLPGDLPRLFVSYHVSRQNTQTGKLTPVMFDKVIGRIQRYLRTR